MFVILITRSSCQITHNKIKFLYHKNICTSKTHVIFRNILPEMHSMILGRRPTMWAGSQERRCHSSLCLIFLSPPLTKLRRCFLKWSWWRGRRWAMQTWDITASRKAVNNSRKWNLLEAIFKSSSGGIPWCKAGEEVSQFSFWLQAELAVFSTSQFKILFWATYTFHKLTVWAEILYPSSCLVIKHTHILPPVFNCLGISKTCISGDYLFLFAL